MTWSRTWLDDNPPCGRVGRAGPVQWRRDARPGAHPASRPRAGEDMTGGGPGPFEIGVFGFGELTADPVAGGRPAGPAGRLREFTGLAR